MAERIFLQMLNNYCREVATRSPSDSKVAEIWADAKRTAGYWEDAVKGKNPNFQPGKV